MTYETAVELSGRNFQLLGVSSMDFQRTGDSLVAPDDDPGCQPSIAFSHTALPSVCALRLPGAFAPPNRKRNKDGIGGNRR